MSSLGPEDTSLPAQDVATHEEGTAPATALSDVLDPPTAETTTASLVAEEVIAQATVVEREAVYEEDLVAASGAVKKTSSKLAKRPASPSGDSANKRAKGSLDGYVVHFEQQTKSLELTCDLRKVLQEG